MTGSSRIPKEKKTLTTPDSNTDSNTNNCNCNTNANTNTKTNTKPNTNTTNTTTNTNTNTTNTNHNITNTNTNITNTTNTNNITTTITNTNTNNTTACKPSSYYSKKILLVYTVVARRQSIVDTVTASFSPRGLVVLRSRRKALVRMCRVRGCTWLRHWTAELRKQVFPRFARPALPL